MCGNVSIHFSRSVECLFLFTNRYLFANAHLNNFTFLIQPPHEIIKAADKSLDFFIYIFNL